MSYGIDLNLTGISFSIQALVDEPTAEYLDAILACGPEHSHDRLIAFNDLSGRALLFNPACLRCATISGWSRTDQPFIDAPDPFRYTFGEVAIALRVYFTDGVSEDHYDIGGQEIAHIFDKVRKTPRETLPFFSFHDEDNDIFCLNPRKIVFVEAHQLHVVSEFLSSEWHDHAALSKPIS